MNSHWNDRDAASYIRRYQSVGEDLALRTYSARLIGQNSDLVLHGGGNTSVKTKMVTVAGDKVSVLCVKGSGWDLDTIEPEGHPAVRMDGLLSLRKLNHLTDEDMVNALRTNMLDFSGPNPSVETLLHAFLPQKFIDHTHADAILALADQSNGIAMVKKWANDRLAVVPYIMPGFQLAKEAANIFEASPHVEGLILMNHGIFTFGNTARESYERMISWVSAAERYLNKARPFKIARAKMPTNTGSLSVATISQILRGHCVLSPDSNWTRGKPMIVRHRTSKQILNFVSHPKAKQLSQIGPATPDHVIRTKPKPMYIDPSALQNEATFRLQSARALSNFKDTYASYVARQIKLKKVKKIPLDPLPRVVLVPGVGLFALAQDAKACDVALDVYEHTINIIENASRIGTYCVLSEADLFDMEYWSLEQAKLGKAKEQTFSRSIVWISGAASGIGLATAAAFGQLGAHLFLTDKNQKNLDEAVKSLRLKDRVLGFACDVTDATQIRKSFTRCTETFGGVDIVISNAGIAPTGFMKKVDSGFLRQSFEVNFFAHQNVAQAAIEIFERQGLGGCLLFNASKSTFNPGPEFGPYTLPKTAVIGLMKQYAVELGSIGVRSNAVNADRVHTNLYSGGLLEKRAKARGVSIHDYLAGNLLNQEVMAEDVAAAFVYLAQAKKTTGATIPVDGGNAAAFPR